MSPERWISLSDGSIRRPLACQRQRPQRDEKDILAHAFVRLIGLSLYQLSTIPLLTVTQNVSSSVDTTSRVRSFKRSNSSAFLSPSTSSSSRVPFLQPHHRWIASGWMAALVLPQCLSCDRPPTNSTSTWILRKPVPRRFQFGRYGHGGDVQGLMDGSPGAFQRISRDFDRCLVRQYWRMLQFLYQLDSSAATFQSLEAACTFFLERPRSWLLVASAISQRRGLTSSRT